MEQFKQRGHCCDFKLKLRAWGAADEWVAVFEHEGDGYGWKEETFGIGFAPQDAPAMAACLAIKEAIEGAK